MKIKFERISSGSYTCTFCAGGKTVVVEEAFTPEKYIMIDDFFGELATRALEQAVENEKRECADKVVKSFINESTSEFLSASAVTKLYEDSYYSKPRLVDMLPSKNPIIISDFTPKTKRIQTKIEKVIFNSPATIVYWSDGDKTVVKATNELFDREKGLAMAISKKFLGNEGNYFNTFKKYIK